jgi:hypothetical protein
MATVTNYENTLGEPMVMVVNDDGTTWSGTQAAYDEMAAANTLPSNSSIPQAGE